MMRKYLVLLAILAGMPLLAYAQSSCPNLARNLSLGSRGNDVVQLQQFLITQNLLATGNNTGYFGRLTEAAVKKFQCKHMSLCSGSPAVNGHGAVGPRTRAAIQLVCITATPPVLPVPTTPIPPFSVPPSCTSLPAQTQTFSCPAGQTGSITQTRTSSCPGPTWSAWQTASNTCAVASAPNPAPTYSVTNLRGGDQPVFVREYAGTNRTYNYDPSVIYENGLYRMYWCGGYAGDFILYAESTQLSGPWHSRSSSMVNTYDTALNPTFTAGDFDGQHTCNPSMIKVGTTYYMYYTGQAQGDPTGRIGVAQSQDGYTWTRMNNGKPIITPANKIAGGSKYGAGAQTISYANGKFYLLYIDTKGQAANPVNGAGEFVIRADDPLFTVSAQTFTGIDWIPLTPETATTYSIFNGINVDLAYIPAWNNFLALSHSDSDLTHAIVFDINFKKVTDQAIAPTQWCDGPGLVTDAGRNAIMRDPKTISVDMMRAVGTCSDPFTWNLGWRGADLVKN